MSLRGYAQRDPKLEYQREGYGLFQDMTARVDAEATEIVFKFTLPDPAEQQAPAPRRAAPSGDGKGLPQSPQNGQNAQAGGKRVGRNDPCPCGSGKKYKKCAAAS